jgi:hypothetical protein
MKLTIVCLLLGFCANAISAEPEPKEKPPNKVRPKLTISKETTYVLGPADQDGCIDYVTALNEYLGKGVTAENNANVLIWKATGADPQRQNDAARIFQTDRNRATARTG